MTEYEIYAVKYAGPFMSSGAFLMWHRDWDKIEERNYYIWCIRGREETIVVDAGVDPELAERRELVGYINPAEVLSRIGVRADEVRHLILTHMHWDHASGVKLFHNATVYVQESEYRFWLSDPIAKRPVFRYLSDEVSTDYLSSLENTDRLRLVKGDEEIVSGVSCMLAPGHTVGLHAVLVNTAKGTAVLGSDCAHVFRNYQEDWPSSLIVDLVEWMRTYDKIREMASSADLIFPGHDVRMITDYPLVAKDISRLV